jgi:hypothetical protein
MLLTLAYVGSFILTFTSSKFNTKRSIFVFIHSSLSFETTPRTSECDPRNIPNFDRLFLCLLSNRSGFYTAQIYRTGHWTAVIISIQNMVSFVVQGSWFKGSKMSTFLSNKYCTSLLLIPIIIIIDV